MTIELNEVVLEALGDLKAQDLVVIDVTSLSDVMDTLIIASGTSFRHVKSLASNMITEGKKYNFRPVGVEGLDAGDWVLVDYGATIVHVMLPQTRLVYDLEKLWVPVTGKTGNLDAPLS